MKSVIQQYNDLLLAGKKYKEVTEKLIEEAKKIDPSISSRGQAMELVERLRRGRGI